MDIRRRYSELRSGNRIDLVDASPLPAPMAIYVEPTNICNFRCVYCPESFSDFAQRSGGFKRLDADTFSDIADQIVALGQLKVLHFYMMGEPFLNRSLPAFIRLAVRKNIANRTCVTTNATVLTADIVDQVLASGLDYLRVSVYGATQESFTRRIGVSHFRLSHVVANVTELRRRRDANGLSKPFIYVKMIETGDEKENGTFRELFGPIADEVALEPAMNWNDPPEGNLSLLSHDEMLSGLYFKNAKRACAFPFYTLVIHSDLRVSVCCVDWAKQAVVGDLRHEQLSDIWHGPALRDFRVSHLRGQRKELPACANCTYLYTSPDNVDRLSADLYLARCERGR